MLHNGKIEFVFTDIDAKLQYRRNYRQTPASIEENLCVIVMYKLWSQNNTEMFHENSNYDYLLVIALGNKVVLMPCP